MDLELDKKARRSLDVRLLVWLVLNFSDFCLLYFLHFRRFRLMEWVLSILWSIKILFPSLILGIAAFCLWFSLLHIVLVTIVCFHQDWEHICWCLLLLWGKIQSWKIPIVALCLSSELATLGFPPSVCVQQPPPPVPGAHHHSGDQLRHDLQEDQDLGQKDYCHSTVCSEEDEQEKENKLYSNHDIYCIFCLLGPS